MFSSFESRASKGEEPEFCAHETSQEKVNNRILRIIVGNRTDFGVFTTPRTPGTTATPPGTTARARGQPARGRDDEDEEDESFCGLEDEEIGDRTVRPEPKRIKSKKTSARAVDDSTSRQALPARDREHCQDSIPDRRTPHAARCIAAKPPNHLSRRKARSRNLAFTP